MKSWLLKLHLWLGLYFLIFLWLFSASGLLLNHHWDFTEFWTNRRQTSSQVPFKPLAAKSDVDRAHELMGQLQLAGEVEWTANRPNEQRIDFRIMRPGRNVEVKADLAAMTASVRDIRLNGWGILRALHTFNGVGANATRAERDWNLTKLWTFAMDALAAGLVALVITSVLLAWERRDRRRSALIAFAAGCFVCGFFVFGLGWLS
jgi:hypothetical protein